MFNQASGRILEEGIETDRLDVRPYRISRVNTGGVRRSPAVEWGAVMEGVDFPTRETRFGDPIFSAVDIGDRILLASIIQEHLAIGAPHEIDQCTIPHMIASLGWEIQKGSEMAPSHTRVGDLSKNLRE